MGEDAKEVMFEKGNLVVYKAPGHDAKEIGFVSSVGEQWIHVRYWCPVSQRVKECSQATRVTDLKQAQVDDFALFQLRDIVG